MRLLVVFAVAALAPAFVHAQLSARYPSRGTFKPSEPIPSETAEEDESAAKYSGFEATRKTSSNRERGRISAASNFTAQQKQDDRSDLSVEKGDLSDEDSGYAVAENHNHHYAPSSSSKAPLKPTKTSKYEYKYKPSYSSTTIKPYVHSVTASNLDFSFLTKTPKYAYKTPATVQTHGYESAEEHNYRPVTTKFAINHPLSLDDDDEGIYKTHPVKPQQHQHHHHHHQRPNQHNWKHHEETGEQQDTGDYHRGGYLPPQTTKKPDYHVENSGFQPSQQVFPDYRPQPSHTESLRTSNKDFTESAPYQGGYSHSNHGKHSPPGPPPSDTLAAPVWSSLKHQHHPSNNGPPPQLHKAPFGEPYHLATGRPNNPNPLEFKPHFKLQDVPNLYPEDPFKGIHANPKGQHKKLHETSHTVEDSVYNPSAFDSHSYVVPAKNAHIHGVHSFHEDVNVSAANKETIYHGGDKAPYGRPPPPPAPSQKQGGRPQKLYPQKKHAPNRRTPGRPIINTPGLQHFRAPNNRDNSQYSFRFSV